MQSYAFSRFGESGVHRGRRHAVKERQTSPERPIHRLVEALRRHSINSASACSSVWAPASISTRLPLGAASFRRVECHLEFAGAAGLRKPIGKLRGFVVTRGRTEMARQPSAVQFGMPTAPVIFASRIGLRRTISMRTPKRSRGFSILSTTMAAACKTGPARGTQPIALKQRLQRELA